MPLDDTNWASQIALSETLPETPTRAAPPKFDLSHKGLDYRPVAWSLRERPDEWRLVEHDGFLVHMPSRHVFGVRGLSFYLWGSKSQCSCERVQRNRASIADWARCRLALGAWRRDHLATLPALPAGCVRSAPVRTYSCVQSVNHQFAGHFLTPA